MTRRTLTTLVAWLMALATLGSAAAHAQDDNLPRYVVRNGDVFFPSDTVPVETSRRLKALVERARAAGIPAAVVMASDSTDLDPNDGLFGQPQRYAARLHEDLRDPDSGRSPRLVLIVAMPAGIGVHGTSDAAASAARSVPIALGADGNDLAVAAGLAVQRVAAASGRPVMREFASGELTTARGRGAGVPLGLALLSIGGIAAGLRARRFRRSA